MMPVVLPGEILENKIVCAENMSSDITEPVHSPSIFIINLVLNFLDE